MPSKEGTRLNIVIIALFSRVSPTIEPGAEKKMGSAQGTVASSRSQAREKTMANSTASNILPLGTTVKTKA
ncbi:hypothetical protein C8R46DRAFT_1066728 [Mycena filopes]|nr:hypothetical protein C8R46DRAFT_1066728 [Mycena filopes]